MSLPNDSIPNGLVPATLYSTVPTLTDLPVYAVIPLPDDFVLVCTGGHSSWKSLVGTYSRGLPRLPL